MIPLSFDSGSGLTWPPKGFSLQWYEQMFTSPVWMQAITRSLIVGVGTGLLAMLIGTPAAFLLVRANMRGKSAMLAFVLSPIVVPRMIIAVGMFYFFARVGLVGSTIGLILAHTVVAVPPLGHAALRDLPHPGCRPDVVGPVRICDLGG
ncbi:hypothetical protein G6F40_015852 [Rhizopus arrhizus]|nr:hypothetical protein G6F40_015852 [Rhizopus arrhizus]